MCCLLLLNNPAYFQHLFALEEFISERYEPMHVSVSKVHFNASALLHFGITRGVDDINDLKALIFISFS